MDSIANAISDSCEPQIIPNIEPNTIDGKNIIIVSVEPEHHRPYYLKSKGKNKGTYVRVGGTTRPASLDKIKELEMEGIRPLYEQIDEAVSFVLRNIRLGAKIEGVQRKEAYELPVEAIREILYRDSLPVEKEKNASDDSVKFGESSVKSSVKYVGVNETCEMILKLIDDNKRISATAIAKELGLSVRAIEKNIKDLRESGKLIRHGSARGGYWEVKEF